MTHICVCKLTIIGSDNGLSPGWRQAIIWTNARILLIRPLGTNFSEIIIRIQTFSFKKMHLKVSSEKWRPFWFGLSVLTYFKTSNVRRTFVGNKLLITQMQLEHRLSALHQRNLHSRLNTWLQWIAEVYYTVYMSRSQQDITRNAFPSCTQVRCLLR